MSLGSHASCKIEERSISMLSFFKSKNTKLREAVANNDLETVKQMIREGANPNEVLVLHLAAEKGYKEILEFLINNGATVNMTASNNRTPLHEAAESGHLEIVEILLSKAANPNKKTMSGVTPSDMSAAYYLENKSRTNYKRITELLISKMKWWDENM